MQALKSDEIEQVNGGLCTVWELVGGSWDFWVNGRLPDCINRAYEDNRPNTNGSFDNIPGDASAGA